MPLDPGPESIDKIANVNLRKCPELIIWNYLPKPFTIQLFERLGETVYCVFNIDSIITWTLQIDPSGLSTLHGSVPC